MKCLAGTYTGPDLGVRWVRPYQQPFGHHAQLNALDPSADAPLDGEVWECGEGQNTGGDLLFQSTRALVDGEIVGELPDGMAMYLPSGQRWTLQTHYTNTSEETLYVQDAYEIEVMLVGDVREWAAAWFMGTDEVVVPVGTSSMRVECAWPHDFSLLSVWGHLHEWGSAIRFERESGDGWETVYDVPTWDPEWTNNANPEYHDAWAFPVVEGERFMVTCSWDNTTGSDLAFPSEMCGVLGVGHGARDAINCNGTIQ